MWLWYSWQSAAVVNEHGDVLDMEFNNARFSVHAAKERLELISSGRLPAEAIILAERFPEAKPTPHGSKELPEFDIPFPTPEQLEVADEAALLMAKEGVAVSAADPDRRLEHLLRASEELRTLHLTMEARLIEWVGLFLPSARFEGDRSQVAGRLSDVSSLTEFANLLEVEDAYEQPSDSEWNSLHDWATMVSNQRRQLDRLEHAIRLSAQSHLPSVSTLVGPLLASRLCVEAHGRLRLARLPAGTVQVLGAEKAFFSHLRSGTAPPKHGHIFMHPWISRSPRWVRGKIARMLAAKISIAARVDAFQGTPFGQEDVDEIEAKVEAIRKEFPKPPRR
jgi:nucleolar protein 56